MKAVSYKASELRAKSQGELNKLLEELTYDRFKLRMQSATEQVVAPHMFKNIRRAIAQIKTIMAEQVKQD